ncbi:ABC transporter permease [Olivibacter domesticus]|uniref:Putative ABC transport system permease protein n=1 Tax=Olivibacter domesticus TaxID=407022 RepID=A0A1H7SF45_OLID1|nr:ABC transporter permease [Olivibacter domesticus]SEL71242.1 putative ABC transport system permease protein [Olivibacter domesticus]
MLKNYFKIAWRNLLRQRTFSSINILGLALGLATCLLISLYIFDELSFDRFHEKADRIVRVVFKGTTPGGKLNEAHVMPPVAQALKTEFPEVEDATRFRRAGKPIFLINGNRFYEEEMAFADANIFNVFSLPLIHGDSKSALKEPNTVVISQDMAKKYFGRINVLGKLLIIKDSNTPLKVTGVMENIPANSHFHFDLFTSMASFGPASSTSWMESEFFTYLLLKKGVDYKGLEGKLPAVFEKYAGPQFPESFGMSYAAFQKAGNAIGLFLQPLTDIHLHSDFASDLSSPGDIRYVYIFGCIAVFMLIIASINFMNLSTAGASKRAREVSVRKVLGSGRQALTYQFLIESILLVFISLLLAVGLTVAGLPLFNHLSGKALDFHDVSNLWLLPVLPAFGLIIGLLSGSYPAFFLSSFKPIAVLKGKLSPENKGLGIRSGLVVFQFFVSIVLIFCTMVVYNQLSYMRNKKLGYDKNQVLVIQSWPLGKNEALFRQQLLEDPRVADVTNSPYVPAGASGNNNFFVHTEEKPSEWVKTLRYDVDDHYLSTLGIELKEGRNFSNTYGTDSLSAIINETAAATFKWKGGALGHTITNKDHKTLRIVGVVKDFHFRSMHERISPLVMVMQQNYGNLLLKAKTEDIDPLLKTIEARYKALQPDLPFSFSFLDERVNNTYATEAKTGYLLGLFAGLTIFVACLGLFGLAMFTADQRTKEIGIRKVLGASVSGIVSMLSKDFIKLVLLAFIIASPLAWWLMNRWLEDFAYRINIQWWIFARAGIGAVLIALLTVSFQAIKAARANPVDSLRNE